MSSRGNPEHRWFLRYALAVASVGLATAITLALTGPAKRTPLFYAAILLAAWYGGTGPGLLAVGLAALARQYYFTPPFHTLAIGSVEHLVEMLIFIAMALVLTVFARTQHRTQAALRQAHAELEARNQSLQAEIAERTQAEAQIRKQAGLLDLTRDSIFALDLNTVITYWNRGAEEKYGWRREEAVGRVSYELLQTVFPVSLAEIKAELHRTGGWDGELVHTARDGTRILAACRWSLQRDAAGHPIGYLETSTDITERRQAEESLRRSEAHLAEAQRLSQIGSWVWDAAAGELTHSSEEHARLLGLDLGTMRSFGAWRDRIHPEDRERVLHAFDDAIRQRMSCQLEYRVVRPDGSMSYIQSVAHPILGSSGELVELVGTDMDVTERRRAEQERQEHLRFFENMDRVNRAIQGTNDLERMMSDVLDAVLESFGCDRAWLVYPCDPQAESWRAVMEHTRPQFPGAFAVGTALPVDAEVAQVFSTALASSDPVVFGPAYDREVPAQVGQRYSIQSIMAMAIYPKGDQPYLFGLHQCSHPRVWTPAEERLFREIGRRLTDALTSLLSFRNLQESQARLKEAQHIAHLGYFTRDVDTGNYTLADETYRIVGLEPQDGPVPFNTLWAVIHPEDRQREEQSVEEAIAAGRPYDVECRVVLPSGEVRIVQTRGSPLSDESGRVRRVFGIMQDVTERKRAEEALQQAQSQLAHVTRMMTLGELTASITHEVNQPLAAVVANGNACRRWLEAVPPNLDEAREALRHIISNGNRASDVVRRIRGLLQRQTPEKERVEVNDLVRGALALTRNELARQQILVRTELSANLPSVVADRGGLEQVLVNLILNAIDAMTGASEPKVLTVASRAEGSVVRVEVRDRGKGCDPEQLRRMFEPFYSTKDDGLGMGLAISRSIVDAHAGRLWAAPNDDAGLTLQFTLPASAGNGA